MENQNRPSPESSKQSEYPQQENVFSGITDFGPYDKNLRNARIWLYVLAGLQLVLGIYEYSRNSNSLLATVAFIIDIFVGLVFLLLALWSRKKPVTAFLSALLFYLVIAVTNSWFDPSSIFKGILIKLLVVLALLKAYKDARDNERLKETLNN